LNSWRGLLKSKQRGKTAKKLDVCLFVFETVYKISGLDLREYPGASSLLKRFVRRDQDQFKQERVW
jgi:hypothetical protein